MPLEHLTIDDMSDREFLLVLHDLREDDGWTDSDAIKERLDLGKRASASSRLSWLARWGAVEREFKTLPNGRPRQRKSGEHVYTQRWRLTTTGAAMAFGRLKTGQQRSLDNMDDTTLLEVTRWLTDRARGSGDVGRKLVAREWRYGSSPNRNGRVS